MYKLFLSVLCIMFLVGCSTKAGKTQLKIRRGMPSSQVIEMLGSPINVKLQPDGTETWLYTPKNIDAAYLYEKDDRQLVIIKGSGPSETTSASQNMIHINVHIDKENKVCCSDYFPHTDSVIY